MTTLNGVLKAVGSPAISMAEVAGLVGEALRGAPAGERRFLVLVPDSTRKAPVADVFRAIHDAVDGRADRVDAMIAQGTHGPMSEAEKSAWVFGGARYPRSTVFDHAWDDPDALTPLGVVPLDDQLDRFGENREFAPLLGFDGDMRIQRQRQAAGVRPPGAADPGAAARGRRLSRAEPNRFSPASRARK